MNIIIPLGGIGQRFLDTGFNLPKPLINLLFKPILFWLLDNLSILKSDKVIIVCNKRLKEYRFSDLIKKNYKNISVVYLEKDTKGAAETVLYGLKEADEDKPTILLDGDTFYRNDILTLYRKSKNKNVVFSFKQEDTRPIYSYVSIKNNKIIDIAEKKRISNLANTGAYAFSSAKILKSYCKSALEKFNKDSQEELYTSSVISRMIEEGEDFSCEILNAEDFEVVGTPLQYKLFQNKHKSNRDYFKEYRICFDLDNTLITYPKSNGDYTTVEPITENIDYANFLHQLGCTIIIYTARRMKTHNGNVGAIFKDVGKITLDTIEKFNIPCDELYFGKPYAHAYVDDLAYNAFDNFPLRLGLTTHHVEERDFNSVKSKTLQVFEKKSSNIKKLGAEVYWYKNIPKNLNKYVPKLISSDLTNGSYLMEKIDGITFSELLVSNSLSIELFDKLLLAISDFHSSENEEKIKSPKSNIYSNYIIKLKNRFNSYDYSTFKNSKEKYAELVDKLKEYESNDQGKHGCVHGDPVFSNVLADNDGDIKLVDPRGQTGEEENSIYGDVMYDYAKIFQSLCGYDEIMLTGWKKLDNNEFIESLYKHISNNHGEKYIEYINIIKNSLLFSLIPLHDNENCEKYYELIT